MQMVKEATQAANVRQNCKVRVNSCNITDNRKFRKRKIQSEVVKEEETERQDEKVSDLEMIKENLLPTLITLYLHPWYAVILQISLLMRILLVCSRHRMTLEDLYCSKTTSENVNLSDGSRLGFYICSDTVFNLRKREKGAFRNRN